MNNLFSAVLIVKNEDERVANAINSITAYCSQIVVVDTGSTDNTVSICSRLGCEVYYFKWNDDFSAARNFGLAHCRYHWIISIDADEILEEFDVSQYGDILNNQLYGGINLEIVNILKDDSTSKTHRYTRLFRNHQQIRYEGKIHEQIRNSIENLDLKIYQSNIRITHYGYQTPNPEKLERNKQLLSKELEDTPSEKWMQYHLAETEFSLNNFPRAEELYNEVINSAQLSPKQNDMVKIRLAQIYLKSNSIDKIFDMLDFASEDIEIEGLRKFVLAAAYLDKKDYSNAYQLYTSQEIQLLKTVDKSITESAINLLKAVLQK